MQVLRSPRKHVVMNPLTSLPIAVLLRHLHAALESFVETWFLLYRFQIVAFECYSNRALNGVYRQNQPATPMVTNQDSFEAVQCTAANTDTLPDFYERM